MSNEKNENNEDEKTNWPGAVMGIAFMIFLLLICFGGDILEAIK